MKNNKTNYGLFSLLIITLAFAVFFGSYYVFYRPLDKQIKKADSDITAAQKEYDEYLSAKWEPDLWQKTVDDSKSLNEIKSLPKEIRPQDQISYVSRMEKMLGFTASHIKISSKSTLNSGSSVKAKNMSFDYHADSFDVLCWIIYIACHDELCPSSVVDFTMNLDKDGTINGVMNVRSFYDPEKGTAPTDSFKEIPKGMDKLFINE